jgi:GTP-binding protein HflX
VVDSSAGQRDAQMQAVREVLEQIGAHAIPQLLVFNKCDLLNAEELEVLKTRFPQGLPVSARTGSGLEGLQRRVEQTVNAKSTLLNVVVPYTEGSLVRLAHERCTIIGESFSEKGTVLQLLIPQSLVSRFEPYVEAG